MTKLEEYNKKRDFKQTKEPSGKVVKRKAKEPLRFVVQRHDATREHYDFRLEVNGVLVSWAIPKQPTTDPEVKRLAIQTEDHPWDYLHFEGTIPPKNYGAGTVMVWDMGTYHTPTETDPAKVEKIVAQEVRKGKVHIVLMGEKLKGEYTLVRMHGKGEKDQWLFFKNEDEYAQTEIPSPDHSVITKRTLAQIAAGDDIWEGGAKKDTTKASPKFDVKKVKGAKLAKMPKRFKPMLATLTDEPFDNKDWIFEIKYDGYRALAFIEGGKVNLWSRNENSFNQAYAPIVKGLESVQQDMVLDGEIVVMDKSGKPVFKDLQNYDNDPKEGLAFMVFDILYLDGFDLTQVPQLERKEILQKVLPDLPGIRYSDHVVGDGKDFFKIADKAGLEGVIAKRANAKYTPNKRTDSWLKVKGVKRQEFVIGGFTPPKSSRKHFGALLLGVNEGNDLKYSGKVGSGFNDADLKQIMEELKPLIRKTSPFSEKITEPGAKYVTPQLVAEIKYSEMTSEGRLRHPVFLGLRDDKPAEKIVEEVPVKQDLIALDESSDKLSFSNLNKIYFPDDGVTKGDVIEYYHNVADYILPYLKDRPQSLRRNPNGIDDQGFFQKDVEGKVPDWIKTSKINSESKGEKITYMICNDKETLLFMANWGCIEINPWSSRVGCINNPDFIVFDLDPIDVPFKDIIKVAKALKKILDQLGAPAYIKTSGSKGLHLYIPLKTDYTYQQTQTFAKLLGVQVRSMYPDLVSLDRMPKDRQNRVYVDFLQNARGKTMSSVYSMRPKPGAPVATPLHWDELDNIQSAAQFNITNIFQRLDKVGDLWKGLFKKTFDLKGAIEGLR